MLQKIRTYTQTYSLHNCTVQSMCEYSVLSNEEEKNSELVFQNFLDVIAYESCFMGKSRKNFEEKVHIHTNITAF